VAKKQEQDKDYKDMSVQECICMVACEIHMLHETIKKQHQKDDRNGQSYIQ
jgi:hypothetical protein